MIETSERIARFTASQVSRLLAGGQGKTTQTYLYELALQSLGIKDEIDTAATRHGINNQINAFEKCILPAYPDAVWFDEYLPINDLCGASPDFLINGCPGDIKCPYEVDAFIEQINSVPTKYYQQVQMQMMACKADIGYLTFYLTRPEVWGQDEWEEYPLPLDQRFSTFAFKKDEELQETILKRVEDNEPKKQKIISLLKSAKVLDFNEFFFMQYDGYKLRKVKDCNNILNLETVYRVGDNFYYEK